MLDTILSAFTNLLNVSNLLSMNIGVFFGILIGALPGLSVLVGVVLFLPFTYGMPPIPGILLLLGIYIGGTFGGSITAILIKTPGTPASAATLLDGPVLAERGEGKKALEMSLLASTIGGIISALILLVAAPPISLIAMKFSAPEFFGLSVFGLSIIAAVSGDNIWKGFTSCHNSFR